MEWEEAISQVEELFEELVRSPAVGWDDRSELPSVGVYVFYETTEDGEEALYVGWSRKSIWGSVAEKAPGRWSPPHQGGANDQGIHSLFLKLKHLKERGRRTEHAAIAGASWPPTAG